MRVVVLLVGALLVASQAQAQGLLRAGQMAFAITQALDYDSTTRALREGASEGNGFMRAVVRRPLLFAVVKGTSASAAIYQSERIWRTGKHKTAVIWMAAVASGYGVIVAHNYAVLRDRRGTP